MAFRKVQSPKNPRGLIYGWLIGPEQDTKIRAALPDWAIVLTVDAPLNVSGADLVAGRALIGCSADTPVGLIGFSAGCQAVRSVLFRNLIPLDRLVGVHVADGTHADVPPENEPWKIQIWADQIKRAKAGKMIFTATTTSMTYTKEIPAGQPGRAWPTSYVLGRALGLGDDALQVGVPLEDGLCHIEKFPSSDCDKAAHMDQLLVHLPATLARYWSHQGPPPPMPPPEPVAEVPEPVPAPPVAWLDPARTLGDRLACWVENELAQHVQEEPLGSNDGPRIRDYDTAPTMRAGKPICVPRTAWCGKMAAFGLHTVGLDLAIPALRVSGFEFETDAKASGTWVQEGQRGDLAIFPRPGGETWWRHVAIVTAPGEFIAGNEGDRVARMPSGSKPLGYVRIG